VRIVVWVWGGRHIRRIHTVFPILQLSFHEILCDLVLGGLRQAPDRCYLSTYDWGPVSNGNGVGECACLTLAV